MSLNIAVTGLAAATTDLSVISDNIANSNTSGFKTSRAEFGDMVNNASNANGMGVKFLRTSQSFSQGTIATTNNTFDMAISGNGFFQVNTDTGTTYTRAGAFSLSKGMGLDPLDPSDTGTGYSYLVNSQAQYLMGYGLTVSPPIATTQVKFDDLILNKGASIPSTEFNPSEPSSYNYATSLTVYDSEGVNHNLKTYFVARSPLAGPPVAEWDVYSLLDGKISPAGQIFPKPAVPAVVGPPAVPAIPAVIGIPTTTLQFDTTTGILLGVAKSYNATTGVPNYTGGTDGFSKVSFDLGRNATLSPTLRFAATTEGDSFISGIGTVPDGSDAVRSIAGSPDQLLRIDLSSMAPKKTDTVGISLNLASAQPRTEASTLLKYDILMENKSGLTGAGSAPSASFSASQLIYDGKGVAHTLKTVFEPVDISSATSPATFPTGDDNTWNITYYLLDSSGAQRASYPGGVWKFYDVDKPSFEGTITGTVNTTGATFTAAGVANPEITSVAFTSNDLGTGASGFVATVNFDDIKIINPPSASAKSSINRLLATSLTSDPTPVNGLPPSMDPGIPDNYNYSTATTIYDSLGNPHTMNIFFRKIADNNWTVYTQFPDVSTLADKIGSLTFDTKGNLLAVRDAFGYINPDVAKADLMSVLDVRFPNGSTPQNVSLDFSKITQFDSKSVTNSIAQNGYKDGILTSVSSDVSGNIIAKYDNDQSQTMGRVALALFNNPQGLQRVGNNNWTQTTESGEPVLRSPGVGVGKLVVNALESSNVDLTQQLVNMITAQRSFQANAQVITTSSTLYQSILNSAR